MDDDFPPLAERVGDNEYLVVPPIVADLEGWRRGRTMIDQGPREAQLCGDDRAAQ